MCVSTVERSRETQKRYAVYRHGVSPTRRFTDTAFHRHGLSPTLPFADLSFHRHGLSPTWRFIDTAVHRHGVSPTRPFTDTAFHRHGLSLTTSPPLPGHPTPQRNGDLHFHCFMFLFVLFFLLRCSAVGRTLIRQRSIC